MSDNASGSGGDSIFVTWLTHQRLRIGRPCVSLREKRPVWAVNICRRALNAKLTSEEKFMKKKWTPHIIAVLALVVFIVLGLACASMPFEERKALLLKPENNKFNLELKMADKNVPYREQSFLYCDSYGVKDKVFMTYTKLRSVVVLPAENDKKIWGRYETGNQKAEWSMTLDLESGQSYWLTDPLWKERNYGQVLWIVIPLNEAGIESYTKNMWGRSSGNLFPYDSKENWESYEEYHQFITQLWQIRKEETSKQLK